MVILRMQATFGCLDGAVLELSDGLNCLVLPNGAGKSTWAAFLTAMFYGVDPAARKSRGRPWRGSPGTTADKYSGTWSGRSFCARP